MPFNSLTDRDDVAALTPEEATSLIDAIPEASAIAQVARQLPPLSRKQLRIPVWETLPYAYFVNGDTGLKQTTDAQWKNTYLNVEEIAVILPIPEAVLDDAGYPIFELAKPQMVTAVGQVFDRAVMYGTNKPAAWPDGIVPMAQDAGHSVALGDVGDIYDDVMAEGGVLNLVEEDGFFVNGHIAALRMKAKLRGLREPNDGQPIFVRDMQDSTRYSLDGEPLTFPRNGSVDPSESLLISGDWSQLVWAIRQDITWKVLDQSVITNSENEIIYNLPQQDMVALRLVFRAGWALPNPMNHVNPDDDTRFPFAVLEPAGS